MKVVAIAVPAMNEPAARARLAAVGRVDVFELETELFLALLERLQEVALAETAQQPVHPAAEQSGLACKEQVLDHDLGRLVQRQAAGQSGLDGGLEPTAQAFDECPVLLRLV